MTETFTASNGVEVTRRGEKLTMSACARNRGDYLYAGHEIALREFFMHERDKELGRWRWPEYPEFVVYPRGPRAVKVLNEATGEVRTLQRAVWSSETPYRDAANAYFAAHPEPKPWHDAKPGEVWVLTTERVDGRWNPAAFTVEAGGGYVKFVPAEPDYSVSHLGLHATVITAGRRIFPEVVSDA